ncbi:MAG TPA: MlaD family protein [Thermoleophilaceae bacterium]
MIVAFLLFGGGGGYNVDAVFENGSQLVKGNAVTIGGTPTGSVDGIELTDTGQARVKMTIDDEYDPLPAGTQAVVRQASLSGVANRYVELQLPPGNKRSGKTIDDGGTIPVTKTTTSVDLDQLFNTLDPKTRNALSQFFRNSAAQYSGKEEQQRAVFRYLNPALSTSSKLFNELNRDSPLLARFLGDSSKLVTALAEKRDELSALVGNANRTFNALGNERAALAESIARLPDFMRQSNTTFLNLRSALDDVDPLVTASKPVAKKLQPFLDQLRPLANDAKPTVRDLADVVLKPGRDNDLFNLQESFPALASAALDEKSRTVDFGGGKKSVGEVPGSFPATTEALKAATPIVARGRPYTPELMGWFDDFSTTGPNDAEGGMARAFAVFNVFDASGNVPQLIPLAERGESLANLARVGQFKRCPGAAEEPALDGSNVLSEAEQKELDCTESARATGPLR